MIPNFLRVAASGLAVSLPVASALGQWSSDPANNLRVADGVGDQAIPKIRATPDGGCYVSWFDSQALGWDVRLQRLDASGHEVWAHNGALVADRGVSSTFDYDLIVDSGGNAIIAYNDDGGVSGTTQQISVSKFSPAGASLWKTTVSGALSGTTVTNPKLSELTDGSYIVAYSISTPSPGAYIVQRLSASGSPLWAGTGIQYAETGHYAAVSDVKPADNGSYVVMWIRGFTNSLSSKYLLAMKYDSAGTPLWSPSDTTGNALGPVSGVIVYMPAPGSAYATSGGSGTYNATQGGSIPNGYQPTMLPDGSGGVVIGWYENAGPRNAYIQHLLGSGALKFATNGVAATFTASSRMRTNGVGFAYNAPSGEYFLTCPETDTSTQSQNSFFAQRFDSAGNRMWGDTGATIVSVNSFQPSFPQCQVMGSGCLAAFLDTRSATTRVVDSARVNQDGTIAWHALVNSDSATDKSRLTSALSTGGFAMVAYGWGSSGSIDIAAARLNGDGTQGNPPCYANCDASTQAPVLNVGDFSCFLTKYAAGDSYANCDNSTQAPVLNVNDFSCFLTKYAAGCP
jgi:hypothetical protein